MVPGPQTRIRFPGPAWAAEAARQPLPPGSTRAPDRSSMASGSRYRLDARTRTFSASAPGQSHDADLPAAGADVPAPGRAPRAAPAAEHGVAGHPGAQPAGIDPVADRGHHAAPLVPRADREADLALGEVGQLPGEQLDVGPADPGPADIDDDLARPGYRRLDILDPGRPGPGNHECAHVPRVPSRAAGPPRRRRLRDRLARDQVLVLGQRNLARRPGQHAQRVRRQVHVHRGALGQVRA